MPIINKHVFLVEKDMKAVRKSEIPVQVHEWSSQLIQAFARPWNTIHVSIWPEPYSGCLWKQVQRRTSNQEATSILLPASDYDYAYVVRWVHKQRRDNTHALPILPSVVLVSSTFCSSSLDFHTSWSSFSPTLTEGRLSWSSGVAPLASGSSGLLGIEQWLSKSWWKPISLSLRSSRHGHGMLGSASPSFLKASRFLIYGERTTLAAITILDTHQLTDNNY